MIGAAGWFGYGTFAGSLGLQPELRPYPSRPSQKRLAVKTWPLPRVYALYFVITGETDAGAAQKWASYREGADLEAIAGLSGQATAVLSGPSTAGASESAVAHVTQLQEAFALNIGKVVGSHATVAQRLDTLAAIEGLTGVMCIFDDFVPGIEDFGRHVLPLLHCR